MTVRLRYTGEHPRTFITARVGEVEPGGEFDVDDDLAPGFLQRADVEQAALPKRRKGAALEAEAES